MKHVLVGALLIISWHVAFAFFVRYETHRFTSRFTQIKRVLKAVTISVFLVWAIDIVLRVHLVTARFLLVFWATSSGLCIVMRLVTRQLLTVVRRSGLNQRHILFVGSSRRALDFAQRIARTEELGYRIIGFATHDPDSVESVRQAGYRALGDMDEVPQIFKREVVDELMICLPIMDYFTEVVDIVRRCQDQGIVVRFAPETFDFRLLTKTQIERFDGDYVVTFFRQNLFWQLVLKGLMDYSVASAVILICLPLFAVVAVLIKLTSAGPVFFTQERVGMNKRRFTLYKFRTMVANAEELRKDLEELNEADGPVFKIKHDPRITRIGKFLRRTSIDELPQLFNVLKGDMSLVGPRPPLATEVEDYAWSDRKRLSMKPGITCLWQVSGRSELSFEKWMELDQQYVDNWNIWLDVKILLKTVPAVLFAKGAS